MIAALQQVLEGDPQCVTKRGHHDMGLDSRLQLME